MIRFGEFLSKYLTESRRIDAFKTKFVEKYETAGYKNPKQTVDKIVDADPSKNKAYSEWLLKLGLKDKRVEEDLPRLRTDLEKFELVKDRLPKEKRDIHRFKSQVDLYNAISLVKDKSKTEEKKEEYAKDIKGADLFYSGSEGKIYIPRTMEASIALGKGTRWCTAATNGNMFNYYTKNGGPLYYFLHKGGDKVAIHLSTAQYMDSADRGMSKQQLMSSPLIKKWLKLVPTKGKLSGVESLEILKKFEIKDVKLMKNISTDGAASLDYAKSMRTEFPMGEKAIFGLDVERIHEYFKIVNKRIPKAEPKILKNATFAMEYHNKVFNGKRWAELEKQRFMKLSFAKKEYESQLK